MHSLLRVLFSASPLVIAVRHQAERTTTLDKTKSVTMKTGYNVVAMATLALWSKQFRVDQSRLSALLVFYLARVNENNKVPNRLKSLAVSQQNKHIPSSRVTQTCTPPTTIVTDIGLDTIFGLFNGRMKRHPQVCTKYHLSNKNFI